MQLCVASTPMPVPMTITHTITLQPSTSTFSGAVGYVLSLSMGTCPKSTDMSCPTRRRVPRSNPDHPTRRMRCWGLLQIMCPAMRRCLVVTPPLGRMIMTGWDPLVGKSARMIQIGIPNRNPTSLTLLVSTKNRVDLPS